MNKADVKNKTLIVVVGPTAVGKTQIAVELAKLYSCEVISTDSRQFYQEMNIGTAKPSKEEMQNIRHHFIGNLSIHEDYSAGQYEIDALKKLDELFETNDFAIAVGGSGLFVNALCFGLDDIPSVSSLIREKWNAERDSKGAAYIQEKVKQIDLPYFKSVDLNNKHRLLRALEVWEESGQKLSDIQKNSIAERPFKIVFIGLNEDRAILYDRINTRVDKMIEAGLLNEVKQLEKFKDLNPLRTVGYQEFYAINPADNANLKIADNAVDLVKRNSRRYAKRQITWFKKMPGISWFSVTDPKIDAKKIQQHILSIAEQNE